jgi:hypothetical protein
MSDPERFVSAADSAASDAQRENEKGKYVPHPVIL